MYTVQMPKKDSLTLTIPAPTARGIKVPKGTIYGDRRTKRNRTRSQTNQTWRREW